jgi:hypothetical protein
MEERKDKAMNETTFLSGLDRGSRSWRDAVGPGFATGPSQAVLDAVANTARLGYCRV